MKNPSLSKATSAQRTGGVKQRGANNPPVNNPQGYNTFDFGSRFAQTARFADIKPFYCKPEIEGNVRRIRPSHSLETFTLSGRPKNDIRMDKQLYCVPWSSIMPKTWQVLYMMPKSTEDIEFDKVDSQISGHLFTKFIYNLVQEVLRFTYSSELTGSEDDIYNSNLFIKYMLPVICVLEDMSSGDSVLYNLGNALPNSNIIDDFTSTWYKMVMHLRNVASTSVIFQRMYFVDSNGVVHNFDLRSGTLSQLRQFVDDYKFYLMYLATMPSTDITDNGLVSIQYALPDV